MRPTSPHPKQKRRGKPLDSEALEALALHYVARYATSRAKLARYLDRKLRERGWEDARSPDVAGVVERCVKARYVDDAAYAAMRSRDLTARGYGSRRVRQQLHADGIDKEEAGEALEIAREGRVEAALAFAARRRLGPYATHAPEDEKARQRALSAMLRAGHDFALSKAILALAPGAPVDPDDFVEILQ